MRKELTIENMKKIAAHRGGRCLSKVYVNARTKLLWECKEGHTWEASPNNIQQGTWCPQCAGTLKKTIEDMQKMAAERGGKCLSKTYVNDSTKLLWGCERKHQWEAVPTSIKQGRWCPKCARNARKTIKEMHKLASLRGGKCLSYTYVNAHTPLSWECNKEHRWEAIYNSIQRGSWCPTCAGNIKFTIQDMKQLAAERGGKCLSKKHINSQTKLSWQCRYGHQWKAIPAHIKKGVWCPDCSVGLGERVCRTFFEQLFGAKFPTFRPKWLVNRKGNQMELDGYCASLKLAFEHHGEQHFTKRTHYITSDKLLEKRKSDDTLKEELCNKHGIVLIAVPEIPNRLPINEVKYFIKKQCEMKKVAFPSDFNSRYLNLKSAYVSTRSARILRQLQDIAEKKGGRCLSKVYVNAHTKLLWECKKEHTWLATPNNIKHSTRSSWCPQCAGTLKKTIEDMQKMAAERGGKCLSKTYVNDSTKLLWGCKEGHRWETKPTNIKEGKWCPRCALKRIGDQRRLTIEKMQAVAVERGGKCLSDKYVNNHTRLLWECANGHRWQATPHNVKDGGRWCPECARKHKKRNKAQLHI